MYLFLETIEDLIEFFIMKLIRNKTLNLKYIGTFDQFT